MTITTRNTATYCDGLSREFTVRLLSHVGDEAPRWAAVAGQTCADPLDCVALTEAEAHAVGQAWARRRTIRVGTDLSSLYRVEPLPAGWSNDGTATPSEAIASRDATTADRSIVAMADDTAQAQGDTHDSADAASVQLVAGGFTKGALWATWHHADGRRAMIVRDRKGRFFVRYLPAPAPVAMVPQPVQQAQARDERQTWQDQARAAGWVEGAGGAWAAPGSSLIREDVPAAPVEPVAPEPASIGVDAFRAEILWRALWRDMDALAKEYDMPRHARRSLSVIEGEGVTVSNLLRDVRAIGNPVREETLHDMLSEYAFLNR